MLLRVAVVSAPPLLATLWLSVPAWQPQPVVVSGTLKAGHACLGLCAEVVAVEGLRLACNADLFGVPYDCPARLLAPGPVTASYAPLPSVAGVLGLAPTAGVLTRLEREGQLVHRRSVRQLVWSALYGGWVFNAVYWTLAGLVIWLWPQSRFSRRVTWQDENPPNPKPP
jgi:hypothetical protein